MTSSVLKTRIRRHGVLPLRKPQQASEREEIVYSPAEFQQTDSTFFNSETVLLLLHFYLYLTWKWPCTGDDV
jgi:hypothetical protein